MRHEAIVILRNPHNHPMHPSTKPSAEDKFKLGMAVKSTGLTGLMVQKLLNATSTSSVYGGHMQKKAEHPHGMGWEGVLHHLNTKEGKLLKSEQYIFTAMSKNGFRLVITMHPQIAMLIHQVLSLVIDFIFKQVEGKMDEWEVVGIVERFKKHRHIEELPQNIPKYVIAHLKSILGLKTKEEIDNWHTFCASQEDPNQIQDWYAHKLANPWILPSINKFLSKISSENWDITPNHSNYIESVHAARNAETGTHLRLLTVILNMMVSRQTDGMEVPSAKSSQANKKWEAHKAAIRNSQLTSYDTLKEERDSGRMKLRHHTDLQEQIIALRKDVEAEMSIRREWAVRRAEIDKEIQRLRDSRLAGARLKGRRPSEHPVGDDVPLVAADEDVGLQAFESNSPVHVNGVLPPDHVTEFNSRFNANMNQNVLLDDLGTVNHPNQYAVQDLNFFPFSLQDDSFSPGELVHGIESGMENRLARWSGLWLSQELPGLASSVYPPSAGTEPDQSIANENVVDPQPEDDDIAPRDINLAFDEQNIVTGKCRCTQSSCVTDPNAADARPTKKRDQNSTSLKLWEVFWEFNFMVMRVQEFNFLIATSRDGHGNSTSIFIVVYHPNIENDLAQGSV
ncbi:hypothetical protein B0H10DRAFT_2194424 [Mycena sp. CBHHK59/15]|nr:hypothetical protein B0H10DRAFT_2194424 [Mycena sp. CBHHK59/15]